MSRIFTKPGHKKPKIKKESVESFFLARAEKIKKVGPLSAVIYQDKNPELAIKRDIAEKKKLLPLLNLDGSQRVLDIGCGTGRWTAELSKNCSYYHGIDFSPELISYAKRTYQEKQSLKFSVASAENYTLESLGEKSGFNRLFCAGILIYMNDKDVEKAFINMANSSLENSIILLREPVGIKHRLTINEHYSDELDQNYNAIYRTTNELISKMSSTLFKKGFTLVRYGNVYESGLNNRKETIQKWFLLEKK